MNIAIDILAGIAFLGASFFVYNKQHGIAVWWFGVGLIILSNK